MIGAKVLVVVRRGRQKSNAWMPHVEELDGARKAGWTSVDLFGRHAVFFFLLVGSRYHYNVPGRS